MALLAFTALLCAPAQAPPNAPRPSASWPARARPSRSRSPARSAARRRSRPRPGRATPAHRMTAPSAPSPAAAEPPVAIEPPYIEYGPAHGRHRPLHARLWDEPPGDAVRDHLPLVPRRGRDPRRHHESARDHGVRHRRRDRLRGDRRGADRGEAPSRRRSARPSSRTAAHDRPALPGPRARLPARRVERQPATRPTTSRDVAARRRAAARLHRRLHAHRRRRRARLQLRAHRRGRMDRREPLHLRHLAAGRAALHAARRRDRPGRDQWVHRQLPQPQPGRGHASSPRRDPPRRVPLPPADHDRRDHREPSGTREHRVERRRA